MAGGHGPAPAVGSPYDGETRGAVLQGGGDPGAAPVAAVRGVAQARCPRQGAGDETYAGQSAQAIQGRGGRGGLVVLDDDVLGFRVEVGGERRTAGIGGPGAGAAGTWRATAAWYFCSSTTDSSTTTLYPVEAEPTTPITPWLRPYGRPDSGRPVASSGSSERTARSMPSPRVSPSGRGSFEDVGCDNRLDSTELTPGRACEHDDEASGTAVAVRPTAKSEAEPRASSGTVAESRNVAPQSVDGLHKSSSQGLRLVNGRSPSANRFGYRARVYFAS